MMTIGGSPRMRIRKKTGESGGANILMMKNQEMKEESNERVKNAKMNEEARTDIRVRKDHLIKETDIANAAMMIVGQEKNAKFPVNEVK